LPFYLIIIGYQFHWQISDPYPVSSRLNNVKRKMRIIGDFNLWLIVLLMINQTTGKEIQQLFFSNIQCDSSSVLKLIEHSYLAIPQLLLKCQECIYQNQKESIYFEKKHLADDGSL